MRQNPIEECPPDDPLLHLTIHANYCGDHWEIWCPQWKCTLTDTNLTRCVASLLAEIENHNDECNYGWQPSPSNDYNAWAQLNNLPKLRPEAHPKPPPKAFGRKQHSKPLPDDGSKTPRVSLWQAST